MSGERGQTAVEYGVLLAVLVAALVGMQIYLKRGTMGKLRSSADQIGEQYAPKHTSSKFTVTTHSDTLSTSTLKKDQDLGGGQKGDVMVNQNIIKQETSSRSGSETVGSLTAELD